MMASLTSSDREQLKNALLKSDSETQKLLGPLLPLDPVQQLLVSFVRDPSKSFEGHVWDPQTQNVLRRLHDSGLDIRDVQADATNVFQREMQRHNAPVDRDFMAEVDAAQSDGKAKFKRGDYYPAMNAFKKSLDALTKFHQDDYYGQQIEPALWEEDVLRERYVTLCNNIAVCAIKLRDTATVRLYADKARRIDETSNKALYALARVNTMEKSYAAARVVLTKAIELYPSNGQFGKLLNEITTAEHEEMQQQLELVSVKDTRERVQAEDNEKRAKDDLERQARYARSVEVTHLPTLEEDNNPMQRLHTYFMQIKNELVVEIDACHNPDNGEPSLFECTISDQLARMELAQGIRANSKKIAKNDAAKVAIKKLWELKKAAGNLLPEEQEHWDAYEEAEHEGRRFVAEETTTQRSQKTETESTATTTSHTDEDPLGYGDFGGVIRLTFFERQREPAALLNQLASQRRLQSVDFKFTDVSPTINEPQFQCSCWINGDQLAVATAISKKKAKARAAQKAIDEAVQRGILAFAGSASEQNPVAVPVPVSATNVEPTAPSTASDAP